MLAKFCHARGGLHRLALWMLTPVVLLILPACGKPAAGQTETSHQKTTGLSDELPLSWSGVILETRKPYPARLALKRDGDAVEGVLIVDPLKEESPHYFVTGTDIPVAGSYDPAQGRLALTTQSGDRRGELILELAVAGEGGIGIFFEVVRDIHRGSPRGKAYFAADDRQEDLKHLAMLTAALQNWRPAPEQGNCPRPLQTWLDETIAFQSERRQPVEAYSIFHTDAFDAAFGGSYETVDPVMFKKNAALIRGACRPEDRVVGRNADQIAYLIASSQFHQDNRLWTFGEPVAEAWASEREALLESDVPLTSIELSEIESIWRYARISDYGLDIRELSNEFERRRAVLAAAKERSDKLAFYDTYKGRFDLLLNVAARHAEEDEDFRAAVQEKLDAYLENAAAAYADTADRPTHAQFMLAWARQAERGSLCPLTKSSGCREIAKLFEARVEAMSSHFANEFDSAADKELEKKEHSPAALAAWVAFSHDMERKYGDLLEIGKLARRWEGFARERQKFQDRISGNLLKELRTLTDAESIIGYEARYFYGDDLETRPLRNIDNLLTEKLADKAPFRAFEGGDYFNALANRNTRRLRELDRDYTQGMRPLMSLSLQSLTLLSPVTSEEVLNEVEHMSVVHAAFGTYLLNYQEAYPDCLGAGPYSFNIVSTSETITKDEYGQELYRVQNWTTRDEYAVPSRLAPHFRTLWRSDFRTRDARFMDWLLNDQRTNSLVDGMDKVMDDFACDSPEIRKLEDGMITYYADVTRRLGHP